MHYVHRWKTNIAPPVVQPTFFDITKLPEPLTIKKGAIHIGTDRTSMYNTDSYPDYPKVLWIDADNILSLDVRLQQEGFSCDDFDVLIGAELPILEGAIKTLPNINIVMTAKPTKPDLDGYLGKRGFVKVNTNNDISATYVRRIVTARIHSGLGNRLFELAFLYAFAKRTCSIPVLCRTLMEDIPVHTTNHWRYKPFYDMFPMIESIEKPHTITEDPTKPCEYVDYCGQIQKHACVAFNGYFQNEKYFCEYKDDIIQYFRDALGMTADMQTNAFFIHVRGRDHAFKWDNMSYYYTNAKQQFGSKKMRVYTDDPDMAEDLGFFQIEPVRDEIETLKQMISCQDGGICCNSTFSWWAAYLGMGDMYTLPFPFNLRFDYTDIYTNKMKRLGIRDMFSDMLSVRYINGKVSFVIFDRIEECSINDTIATCNVFDKSKHNDINYNVFTVVVCDIGNGHESIDVEIYGQRKQVKVVEEVVQKKHFLVAMTLMKQSEVALLPSYVEYYKNMGVEKLYAYIHDNVDCSGFDSFDGFVVYKPWNYPYHRNKCHYAQMGAVNDFLYYSKEASEYILYNDVDEYIRWKLSMSLCDFIHINSSVSCFAFNNRFIKLHDNAVDSDVHKRVMENKWRQSDQVYTYGNRSKCIIKALDISAMGVHKVMVPNNENTLEFGYTSAELLHACNFAGRVNSSVQEREKQF